MAQTDEVTGRQVTPDHDIRVLIVDDEAPARDAARLTLAGMRGVAVIGECGTAAEAVEAVGRLRPDLVLLDIQMPDADGFDVIAAVGADAMPPVVFVTAYDQHALRAFEVHAVDYVLKPFGDVRLRDAVRRACRWIAAGRRTWQATLRALVTDVGAATERRHAERLMIRVDENIRFVRTSSIDWVEASRNHVRLHVGGQVFQIRTTLKSMLDRLDTSQFVQIHRSTVVNIDRITEVQPWFGGDHLAILADGQRLKVSRTFRDRLLRPTL